MPGHESELDASENEDTLQKSWRFDMILEIAHKYRLMAVHGRTASFTDAEARFITAHLLPLDPSNSIGTNDPSRQPSTSFLRNRVTISQESFAEIYDRLLRATSRVEMTDGVLDMTGIGLQANTHLPYRAHPLDLGDLFALPPTMPAQWEEGTRCRIHDQEYRLTNGSWVRIGQPARQDENPVDVRPESNRRQVGGAHYGLSKIQHWDIVALFNLDYFQGQITKYVMRWRAKNGIEDLEKGQHYLEKYIAVEKAKQEAEK